MKVDTGKLTAKIRDLESVINDARKIEGLKKDNIDPVKIVNETFDISTSILLEADEIVPELQKSTSALGMSQGLEDILRKVDNNLANKVEEIKKELLTNYVKKYKIDVKDITKE